MRNYQIVVFFSVVLLIFSLVNIYIYIRGYQALPTTGTIRRWYFWIFLFFSTSYLLSRFLERIWLSPVTNFISFAGAFWLAFMVYLLIGVLLVDFFRLCLLITPWNPSEFISNYGFFKRLLFIIIVGISALTVVAGYINSLNPQVKKLDLHVQKHAGNRKTLHIVMASDVHMGTLIGPRRTAQLVKMINGLEPDIILFAGDIVDENLTPVVHYDLGKSLLQLKAPLGIYAITGNHEYIGGVEAAVAYLQAHRIQVLCDTTIKVDNSFYLAGRIDRDAKRFGVQRKPLPEILQQVDVSLPLILLDHQPFGLQQACESGVDLQLSGHTHHGQMWPFNYITKAVYELSWGYLQKGNTHFYVSCGYGGWGPPVRTANRPEIVDIFLHFN